MNRLGSMTEDNTAESIFAQLIRGTKVFDSVGEFRQTMREHPEDPWLYRILADLQKRNKSFIEADRAYKKSFQLFMEQGRSLQAIASLLRSWTITRPSPHDYRALHSRLRRRASHTSAIADCLAKMSYRQLVAALQQITLVKHPAHQVIRKAGAPEESINFIVYGSLTSTAPDDNGPQEEDVASILRENDFFGDPHPCSAQRTPGNLIKTLTELELIQITKPNLLTLCGEFPDLEIGLANLIKDQARKTKEKIAKFYRKSSRRVSGHHPHPGDFRTGTRQTPALGQVLHQRYLPGRGLRRGRPALSRPAHLGPG